MGKEFDSTSFKSFCNEPVLKPLEECDEVVLFCTSLRGFLLMLCIFLCDIVT